MAKNPLAVIILAAGQGTRMKSKLPKVLHTLCGRTMIGFAVETARTLNPDNIYAVLRHQRDQVASHLQTNYSEVKIVDQDEIAGTGRALQCALQAIDSTASGTVMVICADVPMLSGEELKELYQFHKDNQALVSVMTTTLDQPYGYGRIVKTPKGTISKIVEEKDADEEVKQIKEINSGVYAFEIDFLRQALTEIDSNNAQGELYLTDVVQKAHEAQDGAYAYMIEDYESLQGCNDRIQLAQLRKQMNERICKHWMAQGVTIFDPATTWIDIDVQIGADTTIMPNTILEGKTKIGQDCTIGPDTNLINVQVGDNSTVTRTQGSDSTLGDNVNIGPFAYLRPNTKLSNKGKIGTFVETKNVQIGEGSKVPHLSYVGDATIGKYTNIGAASVFVNYDGVEKHQTVVGDYCRTGSDNMFVAPVTVGDGVYTGAGTVIRKDVPSGALSVNSMEQRIIEGWVEKKRPGTPAAEAAKNKNTKNHS